MGSDLGRDASELVKSLPLTNEQAICNYHKERNSVVIKGKQKW